jgi:hypothetical protein
MAKPSTTQLTLTVVAAAAAGYFLLQQYNKKKKESSADVANLPICEVVFVLGGPGKT